MRPSTRSGRSCKRRRTRLVGRSAKGAVTFSGRRRASLTRWVSSGDRAPLRQDLLSPGGTRASTWSRPGSAVDPERTAAGGEPVTETRAARPPGVSTSNAVVGDRRDQVVTVATDRAVDAGGRRVLEGLVMRLGTGGVEGGLGLLGHRRRRSTVTCMGTGLRRPSLGRAAASRPSPSCTGREAAHHRRRSRQEPPRQLVQEASTARRASGRPTSRAGACRSGRQCLARGLTHGAERGQVSAFPVLRVDEPGTEAVTSATRPGPRPGAAARCA